MTKGKKWTLRLLGVAVLALLICLCLMGSTMARYTSQGDGSGSLTVALWDLESQRETIAGECISPSAAEYGTAAAARTNQSNWMLALTMVNNSAVDADVEVTLKEDESGNANISMTFDDYFTWGVGWDATKYESDTTYIARSQTNEYAQGIMAKFGFTELETGAGGDPATDEEKDEYYKQQFIDLVNDWGIFSLQLAEDGDGKNAGSTLTITDLEAETGTAAVYCEVVWISIYETDDTTLLATVPAGFYENPENTGDTNYNTIQWAEFSDAVDTIIGMYVTGLYFDITWTATQASVQPTEG